MYKFICTIVGIFISYPLSYYFQSSMLRNKLSLGEYVQKFGDVIADKDLVGNVLISLMVCCVLGFVLGFILDSVSSKQKG